jgi:hypothetical protein
MSSAVKICSDALVELGLQPINSFADSSDRALAASNLWPQVRDNVLRSHPWNCALARVVLSPDATAPAFEWSQQFTLPGDCVRVLSIGAKPTDRIPYVVEGGKVLCDEGVVYLRYVRRNDNPATYDPNLFRAMTLAMAAALAVPACEDVGKKQDKERELMAVMRTARAVDGMEAPPESIDDYPFLAARF